MSDKHTLSLDYQIAQARRVKRLEAECNRLRAENQKLRKELEEIKNAK